MLLVFIYYTTRGTLPSQIPLMATDAGQSLEDCTKIIYRIFYSNVNTLTKRMYILCSLFIVLDEIFDKIIL